MESEDDKIRRDIGKKCKACGHHSGSHSGGNGADPDEPSSGADTACEYDDGCQEFIE